MNKNSNWQISRSRWTPTFLKNFMPEFLDFIVSLVEANKPFIKLVQTRQRLKNEFYLYVPEVGGSSILLVSDLKKSFPESVIYIFSDQLSEQRQDHFMQLNPELNRPDQSLLSWALWVKTFGYPTDLDCHKSRPLAFRSAIW